MEGALFYYKLVHKAQIKEIKVKMLGSVWFKIQDNFGTFNWRGIQIFLRVKDEKKKELRLAIKIIFIFLIESI
jgi:hypothetical protein